MRGMAAPENTRRLELPRPAGVDDGAAIHFAVSRKEIQLWLSGMPGPGRSVGNLEYFAAGRDWRAAHGRFHDGSGSERERAGVSPSGLHVLQRWRKCGRNLKAQTLPSYARCAVYCFPNEFPGG